MFGSYNMLVKSFVISTVFEFVLSGTMYGYDMINTIQMTDVDKVHNKLSEQGVETDNVKTVAEHKISDMNCSSIYPPIINITHLSLVAEEYNDLRPVKLNIYCSYFYRSVRNFRHYVRQCMSNLWELTDPTHSEPFLMMEKLCTTGDKNRDDFLDNMVCLREVLPAYKSCERRHLRDVLEQTPIQSGETIILQPAVCVKSRIAYTQCLFQYTKLLCDSNPRTFANIIMQLMNTLYPNTCPFNSQNLREHLITKNSLF